MGVLSDKVELFSGRLVLETLRQWFELIVGVIILVWFIVCAVKLWQTLKSLFIIDTLMIMMLSIRVLLLLIYEFLIPSRAFRFFSDNIYVVILLMIFYTFCKALYPAKHGYCNRRTYVILVLTVLLGNVIFAFATIKRSFHCSDDNVYEGDEISGMILGAVEMAVGT